MTENFGQYDKYKSPLAGRYASDEMLGLFSEQTKISTWRKLWTCLAQAQRELGIDISQKQIDELTDAQENIDFKRAESYERQTRHDVMAHIKTYGDACPSSAGIIHLGATSCFVGDNTDLVIIRRACLVIRKKLITLINDAAKFASLNKNAPTLAYTHFQPAQLTTIGKRACLWIQEILMDLEDLESFIQRLPFRGAKGTTGTQASFLKLFNGDHEKVKQLDFLVTKKMGFNRSFPITGQTYPRKVDAKLISILANIAASASKFSADIRLLAHEREIEEPFLETQVGSSAMAYKRNPMRCERISSLSRFIISLLDFPYQTAANQWLERTLDDSAGKRIVIPEAFLATDSVLILYQSVISGLVIYPEVIKRNMHNEISFMATENLLMAAVQAGGNRQDLHERIRSHSMDAAKKMKSTGKPSDLLERLRSDKCFSNLIENIDEYIDPIKYIGRSPEQVDDFLDETIWPILKKRENDIETSKEDVKV